MYTTKYSKTKVISSVDCTGCSLCSEVCPKKCISMKAGKLGHLFPFVDNKNCIQCNLCVISCPSNNELSLLHPIKAYAAWAKNEEEYNSSSSGGAASIFSKEILRRKGVIYGCYMSSNCNVRHIRVDKEKFLHKLKGSKYVQSDIKDILKLLKRDVNLGLPVLFIGTPCQVAAVKTMFKNVPSNLILVDIVCHGVPSLSILQSYLIKKFGKTTFESVSFRRGTNLVIEIMDNGRLIYKAHYKDDLYYTLFMKGYNYRDSCHRCKYAQPKRVSDITIGDFWGLGKLGHCNIPEHNNGVSVILPITEKGNMLIQSVRNTLNIFERPVEEAILGNAQLRSPSLAGKKIKLYQKLEPIFGMGKAYKLSNLNLFK